MSAVVRWQLTALWLIFLHVLGTSFQGLLQDRPSASVQDSGQTRHPRAWPRSCPRPRISPSCPLNMPTVRNLPAAPPSESCPKKNPCAARGALPLEGGSCFQFPSLAVLGDLARTGCSPGPCCCVVSAPWGKPGKAQQVTPLLKETAKEVWTYVITVT